MLVYKVFPILLRTKLLPTLKTAKVVVDFGQFPRHGRSSGSGARSSLFLVQQHGQQRHPHIEAVHGLAEIHGSGIGVDGLI